MKKIKSVITVLLFVTTISTFASETMTDGAKIGVWTQDYDAAFKLAKDKGKPILLDFTGSDWCFWCKLMDKNVFATNEFKDYAKENFVLISINFPKNKELVPEKYRKRNYKLQAKYGIRGYPTFIILNSKGAELKRLTAGRDKTGKSFVKELKEVFK